MNQVDIYINNQRLDLFQDEEITINLSVQNVQDISKVFTDFTQNFTVPASTVNNSIFSYYYRTDLQGSFDGRFRVSARIEINSLPFRNGVIELENVLLKGTEPYAYSLTFYGDLVSLTDLFGDDYLYDLDLSDYDHPYDDEEIWQRFRYDYDPNFFYPLMSPVKNWFYSSDNNEHDDSNIAYHNDNEEHGIHYYELKPALKVTAVLEAIQAKYGITFSGSFLLNTPFQDLSLWLHRYEGYMYEGQPSATAWETIEFSNTNSPTPDWFDLTTDTWTPVGLSGTGDIYDIVTNITISGYTSDYYIGVFRNGALVGQSIANGTAVVTISDIPVTNNIESLQIAIRPSTNAVITYEVTQMTITSSSAVTSADVYMAAPASYALAKVVVTDLMPEIKVKDFLSGVLKMYNMVIVPTSATNFLLQPLDDWYAAGTDQNYQELLDITEYTVNRPPLYREIEFKYQPTEQILGYQYLHQNNTGYGDLRTFFTFDGDEFVIELPFECPLFERLTDQHNGVLTNVLVYKSITRDTGENNQFNIYVGAPILFYGYYNNYDLSETNPIAYVNADGTTCRRVDGCWYSNTSNRYQSASASYSICFGSDIDPYHLQSVNRSLYNEEWNNYISDLYNAKRRILQVDAVLPVGKIISLNLQNGIVWNNNKYIVNSVSLNMTTGKASFELLNVV
jgi:hypothetical protein